MSSLYTTISISLQFFFVFNVFSMRNLNKFPDFLQTILILLLSLHKFSGLAAETNKNVKSLPSECEKRCHVGFNPTQKTQICEGSRHSGPALCASFAKDTLHMKFDEILRLCRGAPSIMPAKCTQILSGKQRSSFGEQLCAGAETTLPAQCFQELSEYKGTNGK